MVGVHGVPLVHATVDAHAFASGSAPPMILTTALVRISMALRLREKTALIRSVMVITFYLTPKQIIICFKDSFKVNLTSNSDIMFMCFMSFFLFFCNFYTAHRSRKSLFLIT